jgi:O-antigen ligase
MLPYLLGFLFIRPFIASLAYPFVNDLLTVFLLVFAAAWLSGRKAPQHPQVKPLLVPAACFCAALILSALVKGVKADGIREIASLCCGPLLLLVACTLNEEEKERTVFILSLAGLTVSVFVLYQFLFGFSHMARYLSSHPSNSFVYDYIRAKRVFFPFVTPNLLGGYLAMVIPLMLLDKKTSWFAIPAGICLLLTRSMGALAAACCGVVVFWLLSEGKAKRRSFWLLAGLLICAAAVFLIRAGGQQHKLPVFSMVMRLDYWEAAWKIFLSSPLFGTGPGNFNLVHSRYAHNSWLQLAAEAGLPALAAFIWLAWTALTGMWKRGGTRRVMLLTAAAVFLSHNLVDFSFFLPELALLWWALIGL